MECTRTVPRNPTTCRFLDYLCCTHPDDGWKAYRWVFKTLASKHGIERTLAHWHQIFPILDFWQESLLSRPVQNNGKGFGFNFVSDVKERSGTSNGSHR